MTRTEKYHCTGDASGLEHYTNSYSSSGSERSFDLLAWLCGRVWQRQRTTKKKRKKRTGGIHSGPYRGVIRRKNAHSCRRSHRPTFRCSCASRRPSYSASLGGTTCCCSHFASFRLSNRSTGGDYLATFLATSSAPNLALSSPFVECCSKGA